MSALKDNPFLVKDRAGGSAAAAAPARPVPQGLSSNPFLARDRAKVGQSDRSVPTVGPSALSSRPFKSDRGIQSVNVKSAPQQSSPPPLPLKSEVPRQSSPPPLPVKSAASRQSPLLPVRQAPPIAPPPPPPPPPPQQPAPSPLPVRGVQPKLMTAPLPAPPLPARELGGATQAAANASSVRRNSQNSRKLGEAAATAVAMAADAIAAAGGGADSRVAAESSRRNPFAPPVSETSRRLGLLDSGATAATAATAAAAARPRPSRPTQATAVAASETLSNPFAPPASETSRRLGLLDTAPAPPGSSPAVLTPQSTAQATCRPWEAMGAPPPPPRPAHRPAPANLRQ